MSIGILGYGTHIPYWRLRHSTINAALGRGSGSGSRAVAGFDEDSTTMAVEAARTAISDPTRLDALFLATAAPAYADKTNATAVHAALGLARGAIAADLNGAVRSGVAALLAGLHHPGRSLVTLADLRSGPSGSIDERTSGDGAAALVVGSGGSEPVLAEFLGSGSASAEFLDRWRAPGQPWSATWEERFGEQQYTSAATASLENALKSTSLSAGELDRVAVAGSAPRAVKAFVKSAGFPAGVVADDLTGTIGYTGTAHLGILLAAMLDQAQPGQTLAITVLADGADTLIFRTTEAISTHRHRRPVAEQIARGNDSTGYLDFLTWRGAVRRAEPRRPEPDRAAAPASRRMVEWKFGFTGSRCTECGTRHLPPQRVCLRCGATDRMRPERMADVPATIVTFTVDHLAFSPAPPVIGAVVDFDGGGRFSCELTDLDPSAPAVGDRVEMTFRKLSTTDGVHNYFWKARPISEGQHR